MIAARQPGKEQEGEKGETIRGGVRLGGTLEVSQQLNLQKMPTRMEWEVFLAIRRKRWQERKKGEKRERMIDGKEKKEKGKKILLGVVGQYRCLQYKCLEGERGLLRRFKGKVEQETEGANESGRRKVAKAVWMSLKRNFGDDIGGRDNSGIGQRDREWRKTSERKRQDRA